MPLRAKVWSYGKILLLGGALAATFFLFAGLAMRVAVRAREVAVPDLGGRSLADAAALTAASDLQLRVDDARRPDPTVPAEHVLAQEPPAGARIRRQRSVRIWLSAGARIVRAPDLVGDAPRAAEIRAAQDGLAVAHVAEIRSDDYPPDVVVAQDPPPQTVAAAVTLLVNRGQDRVTYVMPDLIGLNGERAADVLRGRGFRVSITARTAMAGVPAGIVVRQTPFGGYQVRPGDAITLEVSR